MKELNKVHFDRFMLIFVFALLIAGFPFGKAISGKSINNSASNYSSLADAVTYTKGFDFSARMTLPVDVLGPEMVKSTSRNPRQQEKIFSFKLPQGVSGPFALVVENGEKINKATYCHKLGRHRSRRLIARKSRVAMAKIWLNGKVLLGPRDINKAKAYATATNIEIEEYNELIVRYVGRSGSFLSLRVVSEECGPVAGGCTDIRICHFDEDGSPHIIEVERSAFTIHLDHGDGLAPESVQTDEDCLEPQVSHEPLSVAATTGEDGVARFVIPETNIRVEATILDESGAPLPGMTTDLFAAGSNYLMVAHDATDYPRYAPATAGGSLFDALPGSALTLTISFTLGLLPPPLCQERVSNGTTAQSNGCSAPLYQYYSYIVPFVGPLPFDLACDKHDLCYGKCDSPKVDCDIDFLGNLMQACVSAPNPALCVPIAMHFYAAVTLVGYGNYVVAQNNVCDCCGPGEIACNDNCVDPNCTGGRFFMINSCTCECPTGTIWNPTSNKCECDWTGYWQLELESDGTDCGTGIDIYNGISSISQNGIDIEYFVKGILYSGEVQGDSVDIIATYPADEGTVNELGTATISSNCNIINATTDWFWNDGSNSCKGTNKYSANRI